PERQLGRCGIAVYRKDPRILYAVVQTDQTAIATVPGQKMTDWQRKGLGPVDAGGIFKSTDRGETWVKVNDLCPRPFYFGQVRVDPNDAQRVWVCGVPLFASADGGKTFRNDAAAGIHGDNHALWIDPADSDHLVLGNDGGLYFSRDGGAHWRRLQNLPIAQLYDIGLDVRRRYRIYGRL